MQAQDSRPPYVVFEPRQVEDRDASIAAGHYVAKDLIFVVVTPQGSKDKIEKEAETWLRDIDQASQEDRFPREWVEAFKRSFTGYKEGREIPVEGTAIVTWPPLSPAQQKAVLDANIRTVEDLAQANESTLSLIGMGARALKERAVSWLATIQDVGKVSAENEALRAANVALTGQVEAQAEVIKQLKAQFKSEKE